MTSGVIAMEKVLPGLYNVTWFILVPFLNILSCGTDVKSLQACLPLNKLTFPVSDQLLMNPY